MGKRVKNTAAAGRQVPRQRTDAEGLRQFLAGIALLHRSRGELAFVCVGTDRSTGDALGPLVGSMLRRDGWEQVIGTLERPCDADSYDAQLARIPAGAAVIAVDACLGRTDLPGRYLVASGPVHPARATGGTLAPVGDFSIAGIVGPLGAKPYWSLQRASLLEVMTMAREIADVIGAVWPGKGSEAGAAHDSGADGRYLDLR